VLGLCPNGLGVIRSLGRKGIPVVGIDYRYPLPGFFSRYTKSYVCPNPYRSPGLLIDFLFDLARKDTQKGVLFPTSDEFVLFISRHRKTLSEQFLFALPEEDIVESLLNKRWQYTKAEETSTPYPQTYYPANMKDVDEIKYLIEYPVIIKPCYTYLWKDKSFKVKGYLAHNPNDLVQVFERIIPTGVDVIVQAVIPGEVTELYEVCCYMNFHHEPMGLFIKQKIRQYPLDMGLGSFMKSVWNDQLAKSAIRMLSGIGYRGIGEIEFKRDPRDGIFKLIEINSRITLQNSLADHCGISFPLIQYKDLTGDNFDVPSDYKKNASWVWAEIDYESYKELRRSKNTVHLSTLKWFYSVLTSDSHAVFAWDDIRPVLSFFKGLVSRRLSCIIRNSD